MRDFLTRLSKARFPYEPLIKLELSKSRLHHNFDAFRKISPGLIAPVLKSNAYGHGLIEIAHILSISDIDKSIPFLIVDSYFEAIALRSAGIRKALVIIGYTPAETIIRSRLTYTSFTVTNIDTLKNLSKSSESTLGGLSSDNFAFMLPFLPRMNKMHLKIDTGMHRQGILPSEIAEAIELIKNNPYMKLEGICSHLSDADNTDDTYTEEQIAIWGHTVKLFKAAFPTLKYCHLSNTDGHAFTSEIEANVSRLGIGLYGLSENAQSFNKLNLSPVMEMKTIISGIKELQPGESIGYGNSYRAEKRMVSAVIPVGYYEGVDRRLSNEGIILVGPNRIPCPIIGRVSMNITSIDITHVPEAKIGMEAVIISNNPTDPNSILNIAKQCGAITYESTVRIPAHLKRVVVE